VVVGDEGVRERGQPGPVTDTGQGVMGGRVVRGGELVA
jgi:hypothetical protein